MGIRSYKNLNWFIDCTFDETIQQTLVELTWIGSPTLFTLFGKFFIRYTDQFLEQKILSHPNDALI